MNHDWDISRAIISDRDSKFMSKFWITIFNKLDITMLTSTTYHSQTNEQFERTNQIVKIALRYHLIVNSDDDWTKMLSFMQAKSNNVKQFITRFALNELIYEFKMNNTIDILIDLLSKDYSRLRLIKREKIEAIIIFANVLSKARYDRAHKSIQIKASDKIYLRLYQRYIIFNLSNHKLFNQRVDSFKIIEKVSNLVFRLDLSSIMKVHFVVSIAQLESTMSNIDLYDRFTNKDSSSIQNEHVITNASSYEIERLIDKRIAHDRSYYLVKWKRYDNEHNVWYSLQALDDASKLVAKYEVELVLRSITRRTTRQTQSQLKSHDSLVLVSRRDLDLHTTTTITRSRLTRDIQSHRGRDSASTRAMNTVQ